MDVSSPSNANSVSAPAPLLVPEGRLAKDESNKLLETGAADAAGGMLKGDGIDTDDNDDDESKFHAFVGSASTTARPCAESKARRLRRDVLGLATAATGNAAGPLPCR